MSWVRSGWSQVWARTPYRVTSSPSSPGKRPASLYVHETHTHSHLVRLQVAWKHKYLQLMNSCLDPTCCDGVSLEVMPTNHLVVLTVCPSPGGGSQYRREDPEERWGVCSQLTNHHGCGCRPPGSKCPQVRPHAPPPFGKRWNMSPRMQSIPARYQCCVCVRVSLGTCWALGKSVTTWATTQWRTSSPTWPWSPTPSVTTATAGNSRTSTRCVCVLKELHFCIKGLLGLNEWVYLTNELQAEQGA